MVALPSKLVPPMEGVKDCEGSGEGPGNERLVELGAVAARSADDVLACLDVDPGVAPEQLSLRD